MQNSTASSMGASAASESIYTLSYAQFCSNLWTYTFQVRWNTDITRRINRFRGSGCPHWTRREILHLLDIKNICIVFGPKLTPVSEVKSSKKLKPYIIHLSDVEFDCKSNGANRIAWIATYAKLFLKTVLVSMAAMSNFAGNPKTTSNRLVSD